MRMCCILEICLDLKWSTTHKHKWHELQDMLICAIGVTISQCTHTSKYHVVHLKYTPYLFVNLTSVKSGRKRKTVAN